MDQYVKGRSYAVNVPKEMKQEKEKGSFANVHLWDGEAGFLSSIGSVQNLERYKTIQVGGKTLGKKDVDDDIGLCGLRIVAADLPFEQNGKRKITGCGR